MVLVDTSVWVSHLRKGNSLLQALLLDSNVVCHPFIIGELACGKIKNRKEVLSLLQALPMAEIVEQDELLAFIERHHLTGTGLGFVDVHLLAAAILIGVPLWTLDRKLKRASVRLDIDFATS
jgi:predicted nucleic acid-binding protein